MSDTPPSAPPPPPAPSLDDAKRRVRAQFLGRSGVHAVGLRRAANAVTVYWDPASPGASAAGGGGAPGDADALRRRVREVAEPFDVVVIESGAAAGPRPTE